MRKEQQIQVVCKQSTYGSLVVTKWKIILGQTVIGELPNKEVAIKRAIDQAKRSEQTTITVVDENQQTKIINI